jgi:hypothetical protein
MQLTAERAPFVMLPRWLLYHPEVGEGAKFLYCVLHDLVQGREGPTRPVTRSQLAATCGVSADTVDRRLARLAAVGAVEKQPQIRAGGQQANVYMVWLTPPAGLHRSDQQGVDNRGRNGAAPVEGDANPQVNRSRESAAPPSVGGAGPHGRGDRGRTGAAPKRDAVEEPGQEQEPPQPPRTAGGRDLGSTTPKPTRSEAGTLRSQGANPRAEAERAEEARLQAAASDRQRKLDEQTEARRRADRRAASDAERLEEEALALSAVLDDAVLARVVARLKSGMPGVLAGSPVAVTRAVIGWCRTAQAGHPGPLECAVSAALDGDLAAAESSPPLVLPATPPDTPPLRSRVAAQLKNREAS